MEEALRGRDILCERAVESDLAFALRDRACAGVAEDCADGGVEVRLQNSCVPQRVADRFVDDGCVCGDQVRVPFWCAAAGDHGDWVSAIEMRLPVGEVDDQAEVVRCHDAGHTAAGVGRIRTADVLVGCLVDDEALLVAG